MLLITKVEPFALNQKIYICDEEKQTIHDTMNYTLPTIESAILSCVQQYDINRIKINGCGLKLKDKIQDNLFSLYDFKNIDVEIGD